MAIDCIAEIPGAAELSNWFGGFPSFHDAKAEFQINSDGTGWLKAHGFRMTDKVDAQGFYVSDKHFVVTVFFGSLCSVSLSDFLPGQFILGALDFKKCDEGIRVDFLDTSYGVSGYVISRNLDLKFEVN
jgi:hypothetical protein